MKNVEAVYLQYFKRVDKQLNITRLKLYEGWKDGWKIESWPSGVSGITFGFTYLA